VLERIDLDAIQSKGYAFQIEGTYRTLRAGFRVVEVAITFIDRTAGESKMSRTIFLERREEVPSLRLAHSGVACERVPRSDARRALLLDERLARPGAVGRYIGLVRDAGVHPLKSDPECGESQGGDLLHGFEEDRAAHLRLACVRSNEA